MDRSAAENSASESWYQDGLAFECTQCGKCCTGEPGFVWVNDEEIDAIADFLHEPRDQVLHLYSRPTQRGRSLREKNQGDCVFYMPGEGCTIYSVRPRQCRTWPFWESNLRTPQDWERTTRICPGSGRGALISAEEITQRMKTIRV